MTTCAIKVCRNYKGRLKTTKTVTYHRIPNDPVVRQEWIDIVRKSRKEAFWVPAKNTLICSDHFRKKDMYLVSNQGRRRLKKRALPCKALFVSSVQSDESSDPDDEADTNIDREPKKTTKNTINIPETSKTEKIKQMKSKNTSQQKHKYDPFKEYANDSTDEDSPEIKEEADSEETESDTSHTEKVFVKSISYEGKKSIDGQSRPKRSRIDTSEDKDDDYVEQLYEFGKYVAEQLLCLDVADAKVARMEITEILLKLTHKNIRTEPSASKAVEKNYTAVSEAQPQNPIVSSVTFSSQVNKTTQPQFLIVNPGSLVRQTSQVCIPEPSVSQTLQVNVTRSSMSQIARINTVGSLVKQTLQVNKEPLQTQYGVTVASSLPKFAAMNVNPSSTPAVPLGYIVVPATKFGLNTTELGNTGRTIISQPGSSTTVESTVTQISSEMVPAGPLVSQLGFSSTDFSEISVKTGPEFESTHVNVFSSVEQEAQVKSEPQSDDET